MERPPLRPGVEQAFRMTYPPEPPKSTPASPREAPGSPKLGQERQDEEEVPLHEGKAGILIDGGGRRREGDAMMNGKRKLRREGSREGPGGGLGVGSGGGGGVRGGTVIGEIGGRVRRLWRKMTNGTELM